MFFIKSKGKYYQFSDDSTVIVNESKNFGLISDLKNTSIDMAKEGIEQQNERLDRYKNNVKENGFIKGAIKNIKDDYKDMGAKLYDAVHPGQKFSEDQLALNKLQNFGSLNHAAKTMRKLFTKMDKINEAEGIIRGMNHSAGGVREIAQKELAKDYSKAQSRAIKIAEAMDKRKLALAYKDATGKSLKGFEKFRPYNTDKEYVKLIKPGKNWNTLLITKVKDAKALKK